MKINFTILSLIAVIVLSSCNVLKNPCEEWPPNCNKVPVNLYPFGNINRIYEDSINTAMEEVAPVQMPFYELKLGENYAADVHENTSEYSRVLPASIFFKDSLKIRTNEEFNTIALDYLTRNVESISFLDKNSGVVSLSHPPTEEFAKYVNLPIRGIVGGTDLFEFKLSDSKDYIFESLSGISGINTIYWESHPFIITNEYEGIPYKLMLWASDTTAPYTLAIDKEGNLKSIGNTDIYYSFYKNNEWTSPKAFPTPINDGIASEGTPFIYCTCKNPILMFSSNRNDKDPNIVLNDGSEDFDLFYVNINIDFLNEEISIPYSAEVKAFDKSDDGLYSEIPNYADSTINSNADDRFPYVAYPYNSTDQYLYLSSNRNNYTQAIFESKDTIVANAGGYDLYRFPLPFNCLEDNLPVTLELYFIDPITGERVETDGTMASLTNNGETVKEETNQNPMIFELSRDKKYEIAGGSTFELGRTDSCGLEKSQYFDIKYNQVTSSFETNNSFFKKRVVNLSDISELEKGTSESIEIVDYFNTIKYDVVLKKETKLNTEKDILKYEDKYVVDVLENENRTFKEVQIHEPGSTATDVVIGSNRSVKAGEIQSIKTRNSGLYTNKLPGGALIRDTIYISKVVDRASCIELVVNLKDVCNPNNEVIEPVVKLVDVTDGENDVTEKFLVSSAAGVFKFNLLADREYKIYGGSTYENRNLCENINERVVNEYYCDASYSNCSNDSCERVSAASVASSLSFEESISTYGIPNNSTLYDTVYLAMKSFEKEPCRREFVEMQIDYRRKVPYFQTGFWEVNTLKNFRRDISKLNNDYALYTKSVTVPGTNGIDTSGAKWIELQRNNTYWKDRNRQARIWEYESYAKTVDTNLNQMASYIDDTMLYFYEKILEKEDCEDCQNNKFVITVEAWSDYRPVKRGWYLPKSNNENTIMYAKPTVGESSYITPDDLESVVVREGDDLGSYNQVLSDLRAYFGYNELIDVLNGMENFSKYTADEVLLPHELVDANGKIVANAAELIAKAKIIIFARGYSTTPANDDRPEFTTSERKVDVEAYQNVRESNLKSYFDLDEVRSIQVIVEQLEYQEGRLIPSKCCYKE